MSEIKENRSSAYIVDIQVHDRHLASKELLNYGLSEDLCNDLTEPSEHIQFEYFKDTLYGELAYSSPNTKQTEEQWHLLHLHLSSISTGKDGLTK